MFFGARRLPLFYSVLLLALICYSSISYGHIDPPDPQSTGNAGYRYLWMGDTPAAIKVFENARQLDPAFPYRWSDLGDAYAIMGASDKAAACFRLAVTLAPESPQIALRAANFFFSNNLPGEALRLGADVLRQTDGFDQSVFRSYVRLGGTQEQILNSGIGSNPRAAQAYFQFLLTGGTRDQLETVWRWMDLKAYIDPHAARGWANWLFQAGSAADAVKVWGEHVASNPDFYCNPANPESSWIDNGSFEADERGGAFDWNDVPVAGVTVAVDSKVIHSGQKSVRLTVDSTDNLDYHHFFQRTWLEPGNYRVEGWIKTQAFSTNQGIGLQVIDPAHPAELNVSTAALAGNRDWTLVSQNFTVAAVARLAELRIVRRPSWDFDNHPRGTAWVDDLRIVRLSR